MSQLNKLAVQHKQLQQRLAQQQGRLGESKRQYETLKQQMVEQFGTHDIETLKLHYQSLLNHRKKAIDMRQQLNDLAERALTMVEQDQQVPQSLLDEIEQATAQLQLHVSSKPVASANSKPQPPAQVSVETENVSDNGINNEPFNAPQSYSY